MISYIEGRITETHLDAIVIEAGGVGYEVFVAATFMQQVGPLDVSKVFVHHHFREDGQALYGFIDTKDRELFRHLISVSGIGPKVGLSILSSMPTGQIVTAILSEDEMTLSSAQGVGKKTAARIILELKSKVTGLSVDVIPRSARKQDVVSSAIKDDVFSALMALGYGQRDIQKIFATLSEIDINRIKTVEDGIRIVLQNSR